VSSSPSIEHDFERPVRQRDRVDGVPLPVPVWLEIVVPDTFNVSLRELAAPQAVRFMRRDGIGILIVFGFVVVEYRVCPCHRSSRK
jgi:hypothetical protein